MAWTDEPTQTQLLQIRQFLRRCVSANIAMKAAYHLSKVANRGQVSMEMARFRKLYYQHRPDAASYFTGEIWEGFDYRTPDEGIRQQAISNLRELGVQA